MEIKVMMVVMGSRLDWEHTTRQLSTIEQISRYAPPDWIISTNLKNQSVNPIFDHAVIENEWMT